MDFGREEKVPTSKLLAVQYGILAIFLLLALGLWRLQVMGGDRYESLAEKNRIRTIPILAPRGKILDREGRIIVDNYPSFSALLLREQPRDLESKIPKIAAGLNISEDEIRQLLRRYAGRAKYEPVVIKQDVTPDELAFIEANKSEIPELETIMVHRRLYPKDGFAAHLIGYVGEVSENDLNRPQFELYQPGAIVGKSGVEQQYNDILIGKDGERRAEVDSRGKEVRRLSKTPAVPGTSLKLTIDLDMQIAAEQALEGHNGAMIAMDPRTGDILAMVSRPTFDPNHFAVRISREEWNKLITDPAKPLLNKAIQAQLAPGSVFKIIMSVAGWQENIAQTLNIHCNGGANFYGRRFGCWVKGGHGAVDLTKAIYQSCDVFFYTLAERLGIGRIAKYSAALGLGQKTGIDLPQEVSGVMPSEEWKIRNFKQKWFAGETISVGIGQGAVATTPIQLIRAIAAISMEGRMVLPHVVNPTDMPNGYVGVNQPVEPKSISIDPNGWTIITDAMGRVLLPEGTAPSAHVPGVDIAGKTGSAQVVSLDTRAKHGNNDAFAQNGWFVGFTPRRNPEIIVAVLFEGGEHGRLAARLATQVIKAYADKQRRIGVKSASTATSNKEIEVSALWNKRDEHASADAVPDGIALGRITVPLSSKSAKPRAKFQSPAYIASRVGAQ
jgi:penicillin-binding protein 2